MNTDREIYQSTKKENSKKNSGTRYKTKKIKVRNKTSNLTPKKKRRK